MSSLARTAERSSVRAVHWFRSDLRMQDNTALAAAASRAGALVPLFVLDDRLLASPRQGAARVRFLLDCVARLADELAARGSALVVRRGDPRAIVPEVARSARAGLVTWSRDYGPYARARDLHVERALARDGVRAESHKDRVVFESDEVRTGSGGPFAVYTPYSRAWWRRFDEAPPAAAPPLRLPPPPAAVASEALPDAKALGFADDSARLPAGGAKAAQRRLRDFLARDVRHYAERRDFPAADATSRLSPHLRFGTISIRRCFQAAREAAADDRRLARGARRWMDELVWREFYAAILAEHPRVLRQSFRPEYDAIEWRDDDAAFAAWCEGRTGYPFVDAAMRELTATGWMHNRARMVVASFLTKDLLVDWRRGERFFMQRLADGDPASNNGGWQWAASTGTDAQPYFRIFNPVAQGERFDPDGEYVRRWVPELEGLRGARVHRPWEAPLEAPRYPARIVDHDERRKQALAAYERARRPVRAR
jgi:deoxyribodipyrimidine photo-lyase